MSNFLSQRELTFHKKSSSGAVNTNDHKKINFEREKIKNLPQKKLSSRDPL